MSDFFGPETSLVYDERNAKLSPIAENMHFLTALVLKGLPAKAKVLCVGVGTGAEILFLSKEYPQWKFVGIDPSASMLAVCRERIEQAGILDRCEFVHGYVSDVQTGEGFDAALSILVGHFVKRADRYGFYQGICDRLKSGGYFVNTELSFDMESEAFPTMLVHWGRIQALMGGTQQSLQALPRQLREILTVLTPVEVEQLIAQSGFDVPTRFFQAFMICGWYARKR